MNEPLVSGDQAEYIRQLLVETKALELALMTSLGALFEAHPDVAEAAAKRANVVLRLGKDSQHDEAVVKARRLINLWRQQVKISDG